MPEAPLAHAESALRAQLAGALDRKLAAARNPADS